MSSTLAGPWHQLDIITMQPQDKLLSMFTAKISERDGTHVIEVPEQETELRTLSIDNSYRVAFLEGRTSAQDTLDGEPANNRRQQQSSSSAPPVEEGDQIDVEIEDVGEQGDGIARVGPGYVIFVSGADIGDRVTIEITEIRDNFGFAEVVAPEPITG